MRFGVHRRTGLDRGIRELMRGMGGTRIVNAVPDLCAWSEHPGAARHERSRKHDCHDEHEFG